MTNPVWREIAKCLSKARQQAAYLKGKIVEAEASLRQAQEECDTVRQKIKDDAAIEVEGTVDLLEKAMEKFEADRSAEDELVNFLTTHQVRYQELAAASISASSNVDALDTSQADRVIADLTTKIDAYEEARNTLQEAETAVSNAEDAHRAAREALAADNKRRKGFQDTVQDWDNNYRYKTLGDELARRVDT